MARPERQRAGPLYQGFAVSGAGAISIGADLELGLPAYAGGSSRRCLSDGSGGLGNQLPDCDVGQ